MPRAGADSCRLVTRNVKRLPPELSEVLRPALPGVGEAILDAIRVEVPDYARPLTGTFGREVRRGVEVALRRFVDEVDRPGSETARRGREVYVGLGRGEARAGRSLDALLAAYRVGARVAWRRMVDAATAGGMEPDVIYDLGEAVFAYIDEISAESVEGYTEEQSRAAGERDRRRRALVRLLAAGPPAPAEQVRAQAGARRRRARARLLAAEPPAPAEQVRAEAVAAGWRLPDRVAALVGPADVARALPHDALVLVDDDGCLAFVPDPHGPGRRAELER